MTRIKSTLTTTSYMFNNTLQQAIKMSSSTSASMIEEIQNYLAKLHAQLPNEVNIKSFGAISDGTYHPCSEWIGPNKRFPTLGALQEVYPFVHQIDESIDYIAIQAASNYITAIKLKGVLRLSGISMVNRELIIRSIQNWIGDCKPDLRLDWRQRADSIVDGTQIRIMDGINKCKTVKTRIGYRGAITDPQDEAISAGINIQSGWVTLTDTFAVICDFDHNLIKSDPGKTIAAIPPSLNSVGEAIEPNYYGAPAVKVPTYWGADCDVGVFVGTRGDVSINCAVIGGFRKHAVLVSAGDSTNLPRLRDWHGDRYPELTINGADGLNCNLIEMWGARSGLSMQGGEPFMDLTRYGHQYKETIQIVFPKLPLHGDRILIGRQTGKCGFQFVTPVNGVYPPVINAGDYPVKIRSTIKATIREFVEAVMEASKFYQEASDTTLGIHSVWASRYDDTSMVLVAKFPKVSAFKDLVSAQLVSGAGRITLVNSGAPLEVSNFKPYFWADTNTPAAELAQWGNKDGSIQDDRGSYGISDSTITDFSIKGIRRGALEVGQISKDRDRYADRLLGACISRDGLAGNTSAKVQKCFIQNGRIGFSGYGSALQFGLCNLTTIDNLVPDEGTSGPTWTSAAENSYGWYMETRTNAVSKMFMRNGNAMPKPAPFRSSMSAYSMLESMGYGIKTQGVSFDGEHVLSRFKLGEYVPVLKGAAVAGNHTYSAQTSGIYQIMGDECTVSFRLNVTTFDQAMSGAFTITLPFPVYNSTSAQGGISFGICVGLNLAVGSHLAGYALNGTDTAALLESNHLGTSSISSLTKFGSSMDIRGQITYRMA